MSEICKHCRHEKQDHCNGLCPIYCTFEPEAPVGEWKPINMQDVRLMAGEGNLTNQDVLRASNAIAAQRLSGQTVRALAEMAARARREPMTPERVREICGDPCGSVFVCDDKQKMAEQLMGKSVLAKDDPEGRVKAIEVDPGRWALRLTKYDASGRRCHHYLAIVTCQGLPASEVEAYAKRFAEAVSTA